MLKAKLLDLMTVMPCRIGEIFKTMDAETSEAFQAVMASEIGHKTIADALRTEGILVSRESIRNARPCFKKETKNQCKCFPTGKTK